MKLLLLATTLFCLITAPSADKSVHTPDQCTPEIASQLRLQESLPSYEVALGSSFAYRLPIEEVFYIPEACKPELVLTLKQKEEPYDSLRLEEDSYLIRGEAVSMRNFHFTITARIKETQARSRPGIINVRRSTTLPINKEVTKWIAYPIMFTMFTICALLYYYARHYVEGITFYTASPNQPYSSTLLPDIEVGNEFGCPYAQTTPVQRRY